MSALDLLRTIAAVSQAPSTGEALPPRVVRFTLEYAETPDPAVERARIAALAGAPAPELGPLDPELLPRFLVLQFADVARTISTPALFALADLLVSELGLVSCTPDVAVRGLEPPTADDLEVESAIADPLLKLTCLTTNKPPLDHHWAVLSVRAEKVWPQTTGQGIVVAQPDTGVAAHPAIEAGLDMARAFNVMTGQAGAVDPLQSGIGNPGHGTATSSVVIGQGNPQGIAPGARVVPIRTIESVVVFDGTPIAKAIAYAIKIQAHVITMSLGGLFLSPALKAALVKAVQADIIVCAAAGNCVQPIVVYPASDPNVLAVAGVGESDAPWRGSSRGHAVAFSAPAENVFIARRAPNDGGAASEQPSEGTSFATAAAAGVAALWLAHHGRANVIAEARGRGITVQRLFRLAVSASARPPKSGTWDARFGAGIIDAEALVALALAAIPATLPAVEAAEEEHDDQTRALIEVMALAAEPEQDPSFDWARFGPEAVYLAGDAWRRTHADQSVWVESALRPEPTAGLENAGLPDPLRRALDPAQAEPRVQAPLPPADRKPTAPSILTLDHGAPPGERGILTESTRTRLRGGTINHDMLQARVDKALSRLEPSDQEPGDWVRRTVAEAFSLGIEGPLPPEHRMVLEAIVRLKDRPAYPVNEGRVLIDPDDDPEWFGALKPFPVAQLAASVGRIDLDGEHVGTGSVVGEGVIMTNRHVLEALAEEVSGPGSTKWLFERGRVTIDFSDTADGSRRFVIKGAVGWGATPTAGRVKFTTLDMVLLEVAATNDAGLLLPERLSLADAADISGGKNEIVTIGYPARPSTAAMRDPVTGAFRQDVMDRLQQIFGLRYGRKYLAPGKVDLIRGAPEGDTARWVFAHEATTLGGNSGSPVTALSDALAISGLHFGGATLVGNYAHSLKAVRASGHLPALDTIGATWE